MGKRAELRSVRYRSPREETKIESAIVVLRHRLYAERALRDCQLRNQTRLGELKFVGGHLRALEIKLCERRQLLSVTRNHLRQFAVSLQRQLAVTINFNFESIQHLRRSQQL